jgi:hypothetical protein
VPETRKQAVIPDKGNLKSQGKNGLLSGIYTSFLASSGKPQAGNGYICPVF